MLRIWFKGRAPALHQPCTTCNTASTYGSRNVLQPLTTLCSAAALLVPCCTAPRGRVCARKLAARGQRRGGLRHGAPGQAHQRGGGAGGLLTWMGVNRGAANLQTETVGLHGGWSAWEFACMGVGRGAGGAVWAVGSRWYRQRGGVLVAIGLDAEVLKCAWQRPCPFHLCISPATV